MNSIINHFSGLITDLFLTKTIDYVNCHRGHCINSSSDPRQSGALKIGESLSQSGVLANHFPLPREGINTNQVYIRDSEGMQGRIYQPRKKRKRDEVIPGPVPGDLSLCPRWAALRRRILEKEANLLLDSEVPLRP